jgi:hypothetical protein
MNWNSFFGPRLVAERLGHLADDLSGAVLTGPILSVGLPFYLSRMQRFGNSKKRQSGSEGVTCYPIQTALAPLILLWNVSF